MEYQKQWEFFKGKVEASQLSHAYVFCGQDQVRITEFTKELIKLVNPGFDSAIEKESFADLMVVKSSNSDSSIKSDMDMMEIDVGQVRKVNHFLSQTSYYGGYKAVVIESADRMNIEAQNSFLKTLEEPKGQTLIVLLSSKPDALLPTISSRCQVIAFLSAQKYEASREEQKTLQELLNILPAELAVKFQYTKKVNLEGDNANLILKTLQRYFRDVMLQKLGVIKIESGLTSNYSIEKIKKIIRLVDTLQYQLATTNVNPKLALEILLMET